MWVIYILEPCMLQYQWKELKRRLQSNQVLKISKSLNVWRLHSFIWQLFLVFFQAQFHDSHWKHYTTFHDSADLKQSLYTTIWSIEFECETSKYLCKSLSNPFLEPVLSIEGKVPWLRKQRECLMGLTPDWSQTPVWTKKCLWLLCFHSFLKCLKFTLKGQ